MTARRLPPGEAPRKAVHLGMAAFALLLRWLTWPQAAACAVAAFLFNWLLLPRLLGHRLVTRREGASDRGVLLYPLVVLALILLYHRPAPLGLALAAFGWGLLAGGDAAAGVAGMLWGRSPLPWNPAKSWEGLGGYVLAGGVLGWGLFLWTLGGRLPLPPDTHAAAAAAVLLAVLAAGLLETVPHGLDDNVLPPLFGTLVLLAGLTAVADRAATSGVLETAGAGALAAAAGINLAIALAAWTVRLLEPAGIAAAWVLGTVTLGLGSWKAYLLLWIFLALGTLATRLRRSHKRRLGLEDEERRGAGHVAANGSLCLLGSVLWGLGGHGELGALLVAGSLAAALADTLASEVGKAWGRTARLLPSLRRVPPGTEGAVSLPGTAAGLLGAALVAAAAAWTGFLPTSWLLPVAAGGFAAMLAEGFLDGLGPATNHGTNLANTVMGPLLALALHRLAGLLPG